ASEKGPPAAVLHCKSAAGLLARAATPGCVFVAVQVAAPAAMRSVHDRFAFTVVVGPLSATKPASYAAVVGAVNAVAVPLSVNPSSAPVVSVVLVLAVQVPAGMAAVHVCAMALPVPRTPSRPSAVATC